MLLANVVEREVDPNFTTAPSIKLLPVTVNVRLDPPLVPMVGEIVVIDGVGLLTVKFKVAVVPPPGPGFVTVTPLAPATVISDAAIVADRCDESLTTTSAV